MNFPSSSHFLYIPIVVMLGLVLGFIWGARTTRESYELARRREEDKERRRAARAAAAAAGATTDDNKPVEDKPAGGPK